MEPAQGKPSRKRRRRLIAALAFAIAMGWWFWPRADARLLGKWALEIVNVVPDPASVVVVEFTRDGHATRTWHRTGKSPFALPGMRWWIEGDQFVFYSQPTPYWPRMKDSALRWWKRVTSGGAPWKTNRSTILKVSQDRIEMVGNPGTEDEARYLYQRLSAGKALP
jgi:hypothetical protein